MSASTAQVSVVLTEMIAETRQAGAQALTRDEAVRCRLGTYALRGGHSFKVAHPHLRSVWACRLERLDRPADLGPVILKTVFRPPINGTVRGTPREVRFYATLGERASTTGLSIPRLYATNVLDDGSVQLFLEHLEDLHETTCRADLYRAAEVLGQFAGHCHTARLHETDWLPVGTLLPQFHHMTAFDRLLAGLPLRQGEAAEILDSYARLLDRLADANAALARELPTLCHGDLNQRNLVIRGEGFAIIDWETVNAGRLGDDLGRLALRLLRAEEPVSEEDDERLIEHYALGAAPFFARDLLPSIGWVYRLRLVIESMGEIDTHWRWVRNAPDMAMRQRRKSILARSYRSMAARARAALSDIDGRG